MTVTLFSFSLKIGDPTGEATAQMNLADLRRTLGVDGDGGCGGMGNSTKGHASEADDDGLYGADSKARRRLSMERMDLLKVCLSSSAFAALLFFAFIFSPSRSPLQTRDGGKSTEGLPKTSISLTSCSMAILLFYYFHHHCFRWSVSILVACTVINPADAGCETTS